MEQGYAILIKDFTKDELNSLSVSQLKKLFSWYKIEYPLKTKKSKVIDLVFEKVKEELETKPELSVRIRRIKDASNC